jgi:hypothetical protein
VTAAISACAMGRIVPFHVPLAPPAIGKAEVGSQRERAGVRMKSIWFLLSALFFVLSAFCSPPGSSCPIPQRRGLRSCSRVSRSPSRL